MSEKGDKKTKKKKKVNKAGFIPLTLLVLAMVFYPFTILFVFGSLPAAMAWMIDKRPQKYVGQTVFILNFCGILPFMFELWDMGGTLKDSISLITNAMTYLVMYSAAGLGWGLTMIAPWIVNFTLNLNYDERLRKLKRQQKSLLEEWGPDVRADHMDLEDFD